MTRGVGVPARLLRERAAATLRRPYVRDLGFCLLYLALAAWLTHGLWPDPATRALALNEEDQILYEWFLAYDARVLSGDFALVTDRLNAPEGVNLLANTSVIAIGMLLSPVTAAFGAPVTFALAVAGNLALTSIAWYLLFSRTLGARRVAAAAGAGLCGFAPAMVSQSNSHLHMTAQWLVPALVWSVLRIVRAAEAAEADDADDAGGRAGGRGMPRRLVAPAVALAGLVTVQVFVGEEVLFLTALTGALVALGYGLSRPAWAIRLAPRFLAAVSLATVLATAALAYPLWVQFAGPRHVPNGAFDPAYYSADLASFPAFSPLSLAGTPAHADLTTGAAEHNTFLGWPLLLVAAGCVVWLRRNPLTWGIVLASVVMAWLSLGPQIVVGGERSQRRGLYALLESVPLVDAALPTRFAVALVPLLATLLVLALDRALGEPAAKVLRPTVVAGIAIALVPIAPKPLPAADRVAVPAFITEGHWRECVPPGGVLVPVPLPDPQRPDPMRWAVAADVSFRLPEGFFIGPYSPGGKALIGNNPQPTSYLLTEVSRTGQVPPIGDGEREQARRDLAFWGASCVALDPSADHPGPLRTALARLLGPGRLSAGVWTWKVG